MFGTNWTNACDIFRDLSVAQGDVPVRVEGTLGAGDKPPALNLKEETEEEYFLCSGGGAINEAPDLGLIQEMLDMVREDPLSDEEISKEVVVISKPPSPTPISKIIKEKIQKNQKRRNIAMESFIGVDVTPKNNVKLLKPEDLLAKPKIVEPDLSTVEASIDKVYGWLVSNEGANRNNKKPAVCLDPPTNMFRKKKAKDGKPPIATETSKDNLSIKTESTSDHKALSPSQLKEFVPSAYATEYLNKFKEKAKVRENLVEDIWTRAEKQMKMLDEQQKVETEDIVACAATTTMAAKDVTTTDNIAASTSHSSEDGTTSPDRPPARPARPAAGPSPRGPRESLQLPGPRHLVMMTEECIVCKAFTEFGFSGFSDMI